MLSVSLYKPLRTTISIRIPIMSDPKEDPIDIYEYLPIFPNPDGTFTRKGLPTVPSTSDPATAISTPVLSKDIPINPSKATFARLYLPRTALDHLSPTKTLPLIIYIHSGGFIVSSVDFTVNHNFCSAMALQLPAVVASVGYRLAPEHRLPAAYDDAVEAIHWLRTTDEAWLRGYADFHNCYIMGSSSGGNIAYHSGLRVADQKGDLDSLRIRGLILLQPFFGGAQRTESELRLKSDPVLPLAVSDFMWEHALPAGKTDRDHEYCNPTTVGGGLKSKSSLQKVKTMGWKVLVSGCEGDPLVDRQVEVARMMEETIGIEVKGIFVKGGRHGQDEIVDGPSAAALFVAIKDFIQKR